MLLDTRPGGLKVMLELSLIKDYKTPSYQAFHITIGGPTSTIAIPFSKLLGLDKRSVGSPETPFNVNIIPDDVTFIANRTVSEYSPINEYFRGSLSHPGVNLDWAEGPGVYTRFRLAVDQNTTTPWFSTRLVLEAMVLENGFVWQSLPLPTKQALQKSSSAAIPLWECDAAWHKPIPAFNLITTPGLNYMSTTSVVSDPLLRWAMSYVIHEGRKGKQITSATDWASYMENNPLTYPTSAPRYELVVTYSQDSVFNTGRTKSVFGQASFPPSSPPSLIVDSSCSSISPLPLGKIRVSRKGRPVTILKPSKRLKKVAEPTAKPKYSPIPRPQFRLSPAALPQGTPTAIVEEATKAFASSVSTNTQQAYTTSFNHLARAETLLGRRFQTPPLKSEISFFTAYLIQRGLSKPTIQSYLSGLRFVSLSRGASSHTPQSDLTLQLMSGMANIQKDAVKEATKCRRRPITLNMLVLIQHSIATHHYWSPYEKSLRWATVLLGYWGSFRLGELLGKEKLKFHPSTALLPTDIQFKTDCVAVWIRSPKVWTEGGDVVEVWQVKENPYLDPVAALLCFMKLRNAAFGQAKDKPVFLHEDGSLYCKSELNVDLKVLLAQFPPLSSSSRECWSAHSFRAGLATLLSNLGFSEEQIKKWGRWRSRAYQVYAQDMALRRSTRSELSTVFGQMLATIV